MNDIVMVHGAFCGGWAFDAFRAPFEAEGYRVRTPDLRGHGAHDAPERVIGVSMADYAADIAALCASLDAPPVLIGHSMGGLVAQLAARKTSLKALVLLAPSPPWGLTGWSMEEAVTAFGVTMMGLSSHGLVEPSRPLMRDYGLQRLPRDDAEAVLQRLRPESARAVSETLNWWLDPFMTTSIGPGPMLTPTLVVAGERDRVHPAATGRLTAHRLGAGFVSEPEMSHWLVGEPGWEGVAETVLNWLAGEARAAA